MSHRRTKPEGQQRTYGLLVGTIKDGQMDPSGRSPHYEIWVRADQDYRIAVNVESVDGSDVLAFFDPKFTSPTKLNLAGPCGGRGRLYTLRTGPGGQGLDYLRDNLFPLDKMTDIPAEGRASRWRTCSMRRSSGPRPIRSRSSLRAASFSRTGAATRRSGFRRKRASMTFT